MRSTAEKKQACSRSLVSKAFTKSSRARQPERFNLSPPPLSHDPIEEPHRLRPPSSVKERFTELGVEAVRFLDGIVQSRWRGKDEAFRVLGLLGTYRREDLVKALERACRYRAFSFSAVERILAAQARPRSDWEACRRRPANIWTTSCGNLPSRLVLRRSINSSWRG